jgi:hypothetical protein
MTPCASSDWARRVGTSRTHVPEPKTAKNRLHMGAHSSGEDGTLAERWARVTATAERLIAAGATVLHSYDGEHLVMSVDTEFHEFRLA